jgi:hypothetical protein
MIKLPQRRNFSTKDDFAAAVTATYEELWGVYLAVPVSDVIPDWAQQMGISSVALPLVLAKEEGAAAHGIASVVKNAISVGFGEIDRIARVEKDGKWWVFFEAK